MTEYQTVTGTETVVRDGTIKLHGPEGFDGMRMAGRLAADILDACADLVFYPQKLINVRLPKGFDWRADSGIAAAQARAEEVLGESGRVLLRPSGTEPLVRVMVEAPTAEAARDAAEAIAAAVRASLSISG